MILSALLTSSLALASAPTSDLSRPTLSPQTPEGSKCLGNLLREKISDPNISLYDFEGPFYRDNATTEYRSWATRVRMPGYIIQIVTDDREGWTFNGESFTALTAHRAANVYGFLRGNDVGPFEFSIDLTPCEAFLK